MRIPANSMLHQLRALVVVPILDPQLTWANLANKCSKRSLKRRLTKLIAKKKFLNLSKAIVLTLLELPALKAHPLIKPRATSL